MKYFISRDFKEKMSAELEPGTSNWLKCILSTSLTSNVSILSCFPLGMPEEKHILVWSSI